MLVVLGAGRANLGLCRSAHATGIPIALVTRDLGDYPCIPYAASTIIADIVHPKQVEEALRGTDVSAVVSACSDRPLHTQAYLNKTYGLSGIIPDVAIASCHKGELKRRLSAAGVNVAAYHFISCPEDLHHAARDVGFPLVVKPADSQGSAGVDILADSSALQRWCEQHTWDSSPWLAEEYLPLPYEFGAQAFLSHGRLLFLSLHHDSLYAPHRPIPVTHSFPFSFPGTVTEQQAIIQDAQQQCEYAIAALGITDGAVNLDLMYSRGQVYVLELTNRVGANGLAEALSAHLGISYYDLIVNQALDNSIEDMWDTRPSTTRPAMSIMLYPPAPSTVTGVQIIDRPRTFVSFDSFLTGPRTIDAVKSSADAVGQIILASDDASLLDQDYRDLDTWVRMTEAYAE